MADTAALRQEFLLKLEEFTIKPFLRPIHGEPTISDQHFVLTKQLKTWMTTPTPGTRHCIAVKLLYKMYAAYGHDAPPLDVDQALESCLLVFCILLELDCVVLLHDFMRNGLRDRKFPKDDLALEQSFRKMGSLTENEAIQLAASFGGKQWKYFPAHLERDMDIVWSSRRILPFCDKQLISDKGLTARIYQVAVPEEFVHDKLKRCYHFALKAFQDDNRNHFDDERAAYRMIKSHKGMVSCLGDFTHGDSEGESTTHNILLEFGDYDLNEYFYRNPPLLPKQIQKFWEDFLQIFVAIRGLHNFEKEILDEQHKYQGCHADIKSDNILVVRGEFKLADPGFARFRKQQVDQLKDDQGWTRPFGGTITYGAPECSLSHPVELDPPKIDMWSLGCVLSEVATWIALGRPGVLMYSMVRQSAISLTQGSNLHRRPSRGSTGDVVEGDYSHNGREVLKEVTEWHDFLRSILRPTDPLTGPILTIIDKHLLRGVPEKRMTSKDLCERLFAVVRNVQPRSVPGMTGLIENVFNKANDIQQQEHQSLARTPGSLDRKAIKRSKVFLQVPADGGLVVSNSKRYTHQISKKKPPDLHMNRSSSKRDQGMAHLPKVPQRVSTGSVAATSPRSSAVVNSLTSFESMFDAHLSCYEKILRRQQVKDQGTKNWLKSKFKRVQDKDRDELLAEELNDRDLVFLVDNAESMAEHWSMAFLLLETLTRKAQNIDKDGMELRFTRTNRHEQPAAGKELDHFRDAMVDPVVRPRAGWKTDMCAKLGDIFSEWLLTPGSPKKNKTIIVLADGIWAGQAREEAVDEKIIEFESVRKASTNNVRQRPMSVQFVSFGADPFALDRLQRLDNDLKAKGIADIVDTEPSDGNIYKMLLGSVSEVWDAQNDEEPVEEDVFDEDLSPGYIGTHLGSPIQTRTSRNSHSRRHLSESSQSTLSPPSHGRNRMSDADDQEYFGKVSSPNYAYR